MVAVTGEIGGVERDVDGEGPTGNERDLRPEYCHYRDEGCEFAASCLNCPFERCLFEEPRGRQRWLKELRYSEMRKLYEDGRGKKELALLFGVCLRTVQRALKNGKTPRSCGNRGRTEENSQRRGG